MKNLRRTMLLVIGLGLALVTVGLAEAAIFDIRIDDSTDTASATVNGSPATLLPDSGGEFIHFTVPFSAAADFSGLSISIDLLESDGGPLSDRLLVTSTTVVDVQFASDPLAATLPQAPVLFFTAVETGEFQEVLTAVFNFQDNSSDTFRFFVRSDAESVRDVPEPAALTLLVIGVISATSYVARRRL